MDRTLAMTYLIRGLVMLLVIPAHEAAHAFVSYKLGDPTAKNYGRLSLNPVRHFDLLGAVCMVVAGIGWAKPVPADVRRFKNPKRDMAISAAAGPVCNLLLGFVGMIFYKLVWYLAPDNAFSSFLITFLLYYVLMNIALAVFNLLPIPPFDGSRMLLVFLPPKLYFGIMKYERYIFMGMFLLLMVGVLDGPLGFLNNLAQTCLWKATGFVEPLLQALHLIGAAGVAV